jgi:outer membrane protein OmpA-like peptidoglycan-associated protein
MVVSGDDFLYMVGRILSLKEAEDHKRILKEEEKRVKEINEQLAAQNVADTRATATSEGITISLSNIQFMANSAELMESERTKIREIARILENVPERHLLVTGHTAMAGTWDEQQRTSRDRAQAVATYLVSLGVRTAQEISVQGYGADRPVADNSTEAGMAQNRRVEITILYSGSTGRRGQ